MKKILGIAVIIIAVFVVIFNSRVDTPAATTERSYSSDVYGLSFDVPTGYALTETEKGSTHRAHHLIYIVDKKDAAPRENSEGPTAITIDIFQNNIDQQSLHSWFHGTNDSNSKLTHDQKFSSTTIAGVEAINYRWSGLYEAEVIAFRHSGNIVMMTVTRISPEDKIVYDFKAILDSLKLIPPRALREEEAVSYVKGMYADLASYPSDNLPPKRIETTLQPNGVWNIGFLSLGSGRPGILQAKCYSITPAKEVKLTGEFKAKGNQTVEKLDLTTCTPAK